MSDMDKQARMKVLQELRKAAMDDMGGGMQNSMKKVTVAAPDADHLEEGLDKAKSMLHGMPEGDEEESPDEMSAEEPMDAPPGDHSEPSTPEEIDAKIMQLLEQKQRMMGKGQ